jgi:hypothetical protein
MPNPEEKARRNERHRQQARARKSRHRRDRELVSPDASSSLGLRIADLARAMRTAGVSTPLTVEQAMAWKRDPDSAPDWLATLRGELLARAAVKEYQEQQEREKYELRRLAHETSAREKLRGGRFFFNREEREFVQDLTYHASVELLRGATAAGLDDLELTALRVYRIDPDDHATWHLHLDGCDGEGGRHCGERIEDMRVTRRVDALIESVQKETAAREWSVGQAVCAWYGTRLGRIVKINKVTVKVRMIGNRSRDGNDVIDKNLDPRYITPVPRTAPTVPEVGDMVTLRDYGGHTRSARVTEVDTPLFEAEYTLKSKQLRRRWFDPFSLQNENDPAE